MFSDARWLARQVASVGSAARVLDPPDLVAGVQRLLGAAAGERD